MATDTCDNLLDLSDFSAHLAAVCACFCQNKSTMYIIVAKTSL